MVSGDDALMDVRAHNAAVWDTGRVAGGRWSTGETAEVIERARAGVWSVRLTPTRRVPADWFPSLPGCDILCLAGGGGQQAPLFAAVGANVTVLDVSVSQLALDRQTAEREYLPLTCVQGDMGDLSCFDTESFDLLFHPSANSYVPDVRVVWREAARVLRPGGVLLAGFNNPATYIFDWKRHERGELVVRHALPFADATDLPADERDEYVAAGVALEFSHTLEDQIGGQLDAGLEVTGFYEDRQPSLALAQFMPTAIATRAKKPHPQPA